MEKISPKLVSHQQRPQAKTFFLLYCICYNLQIYVKRDPGSDRLFFILLPDWYLHKPKFQLKQNKTNAHVHSRLEVRFHQYHIFQSDIRET